MPPLRWLLCCAHRCAHSVYFGCLCVTFLFFSCFSVSLRRGSVSGLCASSRSFCASSGHRELAVLREAQLHAEELDQLDGAQHGRHRLVHQQHRLAVRAQHDRLAQAEPQRLVAVLEGAPARLLGVEDRLADRLPPHQLLVAQRDVQHGQHRPVCGVGGRHAGGQCARRGGLQARGETGRGGVRARGEALAGGARRWRGAPLLLLSCCPAPPKSSANALVHVISSRSPWREGQHVAHLAHERHHGVQDLVAVPRPAVARQPRLELDEDVLPLLCRQLLQQLLGAIILDRKHLDVVLVHLDAPRADRREVGLQQQPLPQRAPTIGTVCDGLHFFNRRPLRRRSLSRRRLRRQLFKRPQGLPVASFGRKAACALLWSAGRRCRRP